MAFEFDASTAKAEEAFDPSTATLEKPASAARKLGDLGLSVAKGVVAVPETVVGLADLVSGGRAGKFVEDSGVRFKDAKSVLSGFQSDDYKGKQQQFNDAEGFIDKAGVALTNPSLISNAIAESVPMIGAVGVGARALMAAAPKVGAVAAGAAGEGIVGAGSAAEGIRQETEDGYITGTQAGLAGLSGVVGGVFGALGGKVSNKLGIADADTAIAGGTLEAGARGADKGIIRRAAEGALSEGVLEELPQSLSEQALHNVALGKDWSQDLDAAAAMGLLSGGAMGAGMGALSRNTPLPPATVPPGPDLALDPSTQLATVQSEEVGAPNVAQTTPPDGRAALTAQQAQQQQERDAQLAAQRAVASHDDEILASTGALDPIKPSQAMGITPEAGPLSRVAAGAVDGGIHDEIQQTQVVDQDRAVYEAHMAQQEAEAQQQDTATQAITKGPLAEAQMSEEDKRAVLFSNQAVADGGRKYEGTQDGDILNGMGAPFATRFAAARRAKLEGTGWTIAPVFDGFVARLKDAFNVSPTTGTEPGSTEPAGPVGDNAVGGVEFGQLDRLSEGDNPSGAVADYVGQSGEQAGGGNAAPVAQGNPQPKSLGTQVTASAGPGFTAKDVLRVENPTPAANEPTARTEATPDAQAQAVGANTDAAEPAPGARTAQVEANGVEKNPAGSAGSAGKPAPGPASLGSVKADMDHLFGIPQKRAKAIDRIAKGSAYFGNPMKAGEFITKNGLKDTHKAVKTSATRWDIVSKQEAPVAPADTAQAAIKPVATTQGQDNGTQTTKAKPSKAQQPAETPEGVAEIEWTRTRNVDRMVLILKAGFPQVTADKLQFKSWENLAPRVQDKLVKVMGPDAAPVRNMQTANAAELSPVTKARNMLMELQAKQDANGMVGDDRLETQINQIKREIAQLEGQNDELDAEMQSYEAKPNPTYSGAKSSSPAIQDFIDGKRDDVPSIEEVKAETKQPLAPADNAPVATETVAKPDAKAALSDEAKAAKAKMFNALGKLAHLAGKNTRMNWTQEEEQQLLPIVIELFDGAIELGSVSFKQAVAYVRDFIANGIDQETADAIPFDTLQGAYISVAGRHKDKPVTSKKTVAGFDSLEELEKSEDEADTPAKDTQNATLKLDSTSPNPLEGVSTEQVSGTGEVAPTGESPDGSGRGDPEGNGSTDSAGVQVSGGVGSDTGAVPVPARGKRSKRGSAGQSGVQGDAGIQPGLGFVDTAGGTGGLIPANPAPNAAPIPAPAFADFTIEDDFALGEGGQKAKFKGNIEAIRLLTQLDTDGRMATPTEQAVLAKYVGWGGLAQAFDEDNADWSKEYTELKGLMSERDYADARVSTRYAHFTSRQVVQDGIYAALERFGFAGGRALEGGAGVGNFIGLMPATMRSASRFTAIEREPFSAKIARNLYPQQNIQEADFTEFVGNDDFYDVAVGNPPFASDPQVDRSGRKHLSGLSLHNYFFAKEVDMLREGGILAQVITNSFMDAQTDTARKYIAEKTKLLGAIRLPNNAFSKNANTEVTTDLIFLQKLPESEWGGKAARANAKEWLAVGQITDAEGRTVPLNQYFIDHPEMMLGKFGAYGTMYRGESTALVQKPGQDTAALLKEAVSKLPANVYVDRAITNTASLQDALIKTLQNPQVQEGGYFEEDGKLFQRIKDIAGEARAQEVTAQSQWTEETKLGDNGFNRIKSLAGMRSTVRSLLAAELANDANMEALRKTLNDQYDAFTKDHGRINDPGTIRVFGDDPDFPLLASLEYGYTPAIGLAAAKSMGIKMVPSTANKGPIFTRRVIDARQQVAKVESPADALNVSMAERGRLDTKYIGELLGKDADEALHELSGGDSPLLFNDPATGEYVLRDAYLSGNVRAKLVQAKQAGMFNNIKALETVQPEDVGAHEINARIGSPWVPESVYQDFAKSLLGEGTDASIKYVKASGGYSSYIHAGSDTANTNTWGTPDYRGSDILSALLNNKPVKVTYKDAEGKTHTDVTGTENANAKAQEMRDKFQDWLFSDADRAELLGRAYNDTNNNYVTRQYDGAWMTFPGKVPNAIVEFRRHQRNAIARIVQDRTALLDHVVGSGKTYTVIASAMELRRTGLAKKPMIAVPNHLVKQWAADFYKLYPGANILTATKKDFEKSNRRKFLAKIATGDWDAVIIAHSSYGFIRPAPDFEAAFNTKQVENIVKTIREVDNGDGEKQQKKRTIKQLEGIKERLENRIKALRDKPMDSLLDFGELGVDQLFVDEAHMFKNLMFSTKMQNIAGLGDSKGSQRAYDMYVKANQLYERNGRGQGVVFATGTPVSNSLAEMYHMMRYLMPTQMEEMGFESFDAWANTYASVEQVWMQKASADGFKAQNRMSNFVNTPELLKVFDQVSDTVTMEDVKKAFSEENQGREFPLPKLKGGKRTPMSLRKSAAQEAYMADIANRALALEKRKGPPQKGEDNILVIMSDARKAAMDVRLVDPTITVREAGGRIDRASQELFARYKQYNDVKGTQLVFSDLGTPLKTAKKELAEYQVLKDRIEAGYGDELLGRAALGDEAAQAKIDDAEDAQEELEAKGRDWLGAMQAAERGFSVYDDLKAALIEKGIPENEIAFIHDYNTDEQKAGLFRKVNSGQIRILLGSTQKLGAGTNVQERLVALHHLDVPWKPSDVEQREGRVIRQGNTLAPVEGRAGGLPGFEVEILAYVTQDTLDMRMWQVQETKLKMINQLRTRKIGRDIENAFEDLELSAGEMQAAATGNIDLLREIQIKGEIKKLEQRKRAFDAQKSDLQSRKNSVSQKLESLPAKIESSKGMAEASDQYRTELAAIGEGFKATIDGKDYTDAKEAGAVLLAMIDNKVYMQRQADGKYGGRQLTEAQVAAEPEQDKKAADYNPWAARPVPLSVNMNGEVFTSRDKLTEAFSNLRGDREPIAWTFGGEAFNRRTQIATAIRQAVAESIADEQVKEIGKLGPFSVSVEGQSAKLEKVLDVVLTYMGQTISNARSLYAVDEAGIERTVPVVVVMAENLAVSARQQHEYEKRQLENAKREKAELDAAPVSGDWPDQPKLVELRKKHQEVLRNLSSAGVTATADGETLEGAMGAIPDTTANTTDVVFSRPTFSRGAQSQANESVERLARGIASHWENPPEVVIAFDMNDPVIPEKVRAEDQRQRSGGASGTPEGFYYKGTVYLMSSKLGTPNDIARVLFHESLGHYGLRGTFGKALRPILRGVAMMRKAEVDAKITQYGLKMGSQLDRFTAAEEVLAELAQTKPELGFVQRAIAAVRTWLRQNVPGFNNMRLSDNELIQNYILPARAWVERGGPGGGGGGLPAMSRADDAETMFSRSVGDTLTSATNSVRDVALPAGYKVNDLIGSVPGKLNWWHKTVGTQYNLAQRSTAFKRVFDGVQNFINDVSYFATEAADLAPTILPKLESWKDITRAAMSPEDAKALSRPVFEGTLLWGRDTSGKPVKMEVLEAEAAKIPTADKAQILIRKNLVSNQVMTMWRGMQLDQYNALIESKYEREMLRPGVVWKDAELKSMFGLNEKQIPLYKEFRAATNKSLTNLAITDMLRYAGKDAAPIRDVVQSSKTAMEAAETLRDYLLSLTDDGDSARTNVLTDTANTIIDKGTRALDLIDRGYAPLSRFGQHTVDVLDAEGERVYFGMFESTMDAAKMARDMTALHPGATVKRDTVSQEEYKLFAGVSPETLELFGDMLGLEAKGDDAAAKAFQTYIKLAKNNRSSMKRLMTRKGIAGFSEDAGRVLAGFVYSNARQSSKNLHMGEMSEAASVVGQNPDGTKNGDGELKDAAVQLVDYIQNPMEEAQAVRGLMFAQYIGGSVASAMVNLTQPITMTFPWLSQYGGGIKAAKQMTAAMQDALKARTGDAKLDAAIKRAEEDGTVSPQEVHQLMQQSQGKGALRSGDGTTAGNALATAQNGVARLGLAWGKLFGVAEQFNRRVTFIAAFRTAVAEGMADPDGFARKAISETQGIYNKGNKPKWARGAIGATLFTFKQFSVSYVEMLSRMAKNGPEGKKAAALALGVLFLMAGAGGFPGAEDLDDIISGVLQSMGYNFDSAAKRKAFFVELFGEGGARFMESGISGLPGVPIDVSGRMGLGNLIPGTGLFTKKTDHTRDVTEVLGPVGDLAKRGFEAAGKAIGGHVFGVDGAIMTASPVAARNLVKAYDMYTTGMYRDQSGKKVIDVDGSDVLAKAIGFQPNDVKRVQDAGQEAVRMIGLNKMRESEIADEWAKGLFEKDVEKVKAAREDLAKWNATNPESPISIKFSQVLSRVKQMNMTKEQRIAKTAPAEIRAAVRQELEAR